MLISSIQAKNGLQPVAIFDLDGTLVRGDTFLPFLITYSLRYRRLWPLFSAPFYLILYACGLLPAGSAKERLLTLFFGRRQEREIGEHSKWFCLNWFSRRLRPQVVMKLRDVVCTRVTVTGGVCRGTIIGSNCKGRAKLLLLQEHLGTPDAPDESYAYANGRNDLLMLRWVKHGYLVTRSGEFQQVGRNLPSR